MASYLVNFLRCMDIKLLIRNVKTNRKAANMAFAMIIVLVISLAVLIWFFFFAKKLGEKSTEGTKALKDVLRTGGV